MHKHMTSNFTFKNESGSSESPVQHVFRLLLPRTSVCMYVGMFGRHRHRRAKKFRAGHYQKVVLSLPV